MTLLDYEFEIINLGDERLNKRAISILETLGLAPGRSIPQSFKSRKELKACYRFFDNDQVSEEKLLQPHLEKTIERIKEYPVVLLLSDTTDLNYTTKKAMKGKERLSNAQEGLWLHLTIAVTPQRLNLGVIDADFWERKSKEEIHRTDRDYLPIEEKESYRWLRSYRKSSEIAKSTPKTQIINIADREGDIAEVFVEAAKQKDEEICSDFIIRSQYDRQLENEEVADEHNEYTVKINKKLRQRLKESPVLGEIEFTIASREGTAARKVKQKLKAVAVTLKPRAKNGKEKKVKVNAVMAEEENPPEGQKPLIWIFITSLPIKTFEDVLKVIKYYLSRWEIELFFKVLKSGCKVEERQLQDTDRMKRLISLFLILSWRIIFTMMLGRICSEISCGDIFEASEWKSVYKILNKNSPLPRNPPSLGNFIIMVATLGGYVKQKKGKPPGVKIMWKGMARMVDFAIAWDAFGSRNDTEDDV